MKRIILSILLIIISAPCLAQQKADSFLFFNNMKGNRKIAVEKAILHVGPSTGAAAVDTLNLGADIDVLMTVPYFEMRENIESPWLKITYQKNGFTKVSFVSAIDVSLTETILLDNIQILFAVANNAIKVGNNVEHKLDNYNCKLLVLKINILHDSKEVSIPENFNADSITTNVLKNVCLKNVSEIVQINLKSNQSSNGSLQFNFANCDNQNFVQLPIIQSYVNEKINNTSSQELKILNKNSFIITQKESLNSSFKKETIYKWHDCNYFIK